MNHRLLRRAGFASAGMAAIAGALFLLIGIVDQTVGPPARVLFANGLVEGKVDNDCINRSLRKEFGVVSFYGAMTGEPPVGGEGAVFEYYQFRDPAGWVEFMFIPGRAGTRVEHSFFTHAQHIEPTNLALAQAIMNRAVIRLKASCGIGLSNSPLRVGPGPSERTS